MRTPMALLGAFLFRWGKKTRKEGNMTPEEKQPQIHEAMSDEKVTQSNQSVAWGRLGGRPKKPSPNSFEETLAQLSAELAKFPG